MNMTEVKSVEKARPLSDDEEEDDLFGDDSDGANEEEPRQDAEEDEDDDQDEAEVNDEEGGYVEDIEQAVEASVPYARANLGSGNNIYHLKTPAFLQFEQRVYNHDRFVSEVAEEQEGLADRTKWQMDKLRVDNTMRWRHKRDENGSIIGRESNCRFVKWSDGSMSLLVGRDIYEAQTKTIPLEHSYYGHVFSKDIMGLQGRFTNNIALFPLKTSTLAFKKVQDSLLEQQQDTTAKVKEFATEEDPEKMKRDVEQAEMEKIKARRRLENQRRAQNLKYQAAEDEDLSGYGFSRRGISAAKTEKYADEDDTGFVVDDEEEERREQERIDRLRKIKQQGIDRYRARAPVSDDEEEEDAEADSDDDKDAEEEEEEEEAQSTESEDITATALPDTEPQSSRTKENEPKRRRIIASDDEE